MYHLKLSPDAHVAVGDGRIRRAGPKAPCSVKPWHAQPGGAPKLKSQYHAFLERSTHFSEVSLASGVIPSDAPPLLVHRVLDLYQNIAAGIGCKLQRGEYEADGFIGRWGLDRRVTICTVQS